MNDSLDDAFGGDDSSFTETMTGIVRSVGSSLSAAAGRKNTAAPPLTVAADAGGSLLGNPKILGMGAAAVIVLAGLGWWLFSGPDKPAAVQESATSTARITEADPVLDAPAAAADARLATNELVAEARLAASAGQIFNPPGSNAIELYMAALAANPADAAIAAELDGIIGQALGMAEAAMLAHRAQDASAALQRVALGDPDNARLPFLKAQLVNMQLRDYLDAARLAMREGRYEDAAVALNGARALGSDGAAEISLVAEELAATLSAQRIDDVLAKANKRLEDGKLTAPSNDNARYYFELALSNDPANTAARQGLNVIASKLVLQARSEIDAGRFDAADNLLVDARRLDPGSSELAAAGTVLSTARDQQAAGTTRRGTTHRRCESRCRKRGRRTPRGSAGSRTARRRKSGCRAESGRAGSRCRNSNRKRSRAACFRHA